MTPQQLLTVNAAGGVMIIAKNTSKVFVDETAAAKSSHLSQKALANGRSSATLGISTYARPHWRRFDIMARPDGPANLCGASTLWGMSPAFLKAIEQDLALPTHRWKVRGAAVGTKSIGCGSPSTWPPYGRGVLGAARGVRLSADTRAKVAWS